MAGYDLRRLRCFFSGGQACLAIDHAERTNMSHVMLQRSHVARNASRNTLITHCFQYGEASPTTSFSTVGSPFGFFFSPSLAQQEVFSSRIREIPSAEYELFSGDPCAFSRLSAGAEPRPRPLPPREPHLRDKERFSHAFARSVICVMLRDAEHGRLMLPDAIVVTAWEGNVMSRSRRVCFFGAEKL